MISPAAQAVLNAAAAAMQLTATFKTVLPPLCGLLLIMWCLPSQKTKT